MRIMVMGTGDFAVPTFKKLIADSRHEIMGLVAIQPPETPENNSRATSNAAVSPGIVVDTLRPGAGARKRREASPMEKVALEKKINIFYTDNVNSFSFYRFLYLAQTDLLFVCDFGKILSAQILDSTKYGGINLHGSLLPKYRGAAPVHWAILNGEKTTGISIILMTSKLDGGPIIAASDPIPIGPKETVLEVERKLANLGADIVLKTIERMESDEHLPIIGQQETAVSHAPKIKKQDGLIDWAKPAEYIRNHYRAMYPWPASYTFWHSADGKTLRLKLGPFTVVTHPQETGQPGKVLVADGHTLLIAAGQGAVRVERVHPDGKKPMESAAFMRGYNIKPGDIFGEIRARREWMEKS